MKKSIVALLVVALAGVATASAGISNWQAIWLDNSPYDMNATGWTWNSQALTWTQWESYVAPGQDLAIAQATAFADVDPIIHITKTVTNGSTFAWTDYHIGVSGSAGVGYIAGSATSNVFGTIVENGNNIDFYAPNVVPIGGTVTFAFDVLIPAGPFSFDISQLPTPEPASFALLGLGALLIRRR